MRWKQITHCCHTSDWQTAEVNPQDENKLPTIVTRQIEKKNVEDTAQSENKLPTTVTRQIDK